jgi:predicted DNA binding CopG/RHH family protein
MKRVSLFLTTSQITALQHRAAATGLKFAELVRRAIDQYLATPKA